MKLMTLTTVLKRLTASIVVLVVVVGVAVFGMQFLASMGSPKTVALEFLQKLATKDYNGARNLGSATFQKQNTAQDIDQKLSYLNAPNDQFQVVKSETSINGTAVVVIDLVAKNKMVADQVGFKLVKSSGGWEVDALQAY